jgi:hypothetical protein
MMDNIILLKSNDRFCLVRLGRFPTELGLTSFMRLTLLFYVIRGAMLYFEGGIILLFISSTEILVSSLKNSIHSTTWIIIVIVCY